MGKKKMKPTSKQQQNNKKKTEDEPSTVEIKLAVDMFIFIEEKLENHWNIWRDISW